METELRHEEVLRIIGLDSTRKDMVILGAILKAQRDPTEFIDFVTLREQLAKDEGTRKGKDSLIYRSLSWLEKEGFVKIDSSGRKHGYNSSVKTIERAIERIVNDKILDMKKELKQIDSDVTALSEISSDALASHLIDVSIGKSKIEKSIFAQGFDNILRLLDDKVYKNLKRGDVIRITLEWLSHGNYLNSKRVANAEKLVKSGVEFRALDYDRGEGIIREKMKQSILNWKKEFGTVGYRILPRKDATYQFVARNNEGIVLVVSERPLSATWLPRDANPDLVDNAIDSFDQDYVAGQDILDFEG
ncbi:MAG: hypothetical protein ACFFDQ_08950 [Candidatus Thorarchaeota archaeon]